MNKILIHGFTLVELMVVVAIIGILAAWGFPHYATYTANARLVQAHEALTTYKNQMEQFFQDNRTYASAGNTCGVPVAPFNNRMEHFVLACTASGVGFNASATATARGGTQLSNIQFTVNETGAKRTLKNNIALGNAGSCWARTIQGTC